MHQRKKLRLRDWLVENIDAGLHGLKWEGHPDKQTFRVPWKHGSRHGWSVKDDAALFRAWATYTGKYKEGKDKPDPRKWKTNFRCALNALPDIEEIREKSCPRGKDAFKIYRMRTVRRGDHSLSLPSRAKDLKRSLQALSLLPFEPPDMWSAADRRSSMSDEDAKIVTMVDNMMNETVSPYYLNTPNGSEDSNLSSFCYGFLPDPGMNQFPFPRPHPSVEGFD
ncbi:interferon regulatory factor 2-like isoform X2 [Montipora capricornis]|uniref:interferon regulatory factor 2-like isoform X2 n=1 Tax=Montipora foliosa TaxID=591990 RepID=UPI0035F11648